MQFPRMTEKLVKSLKMALGAFRKGSGRGTCAWALCVGGGGGGGNIIITEIGAGGTAGQSRDMQQSAGGERRQ